MRKPNLVFWTMALLLAIAFGGIAAAEVKPELKAEQHQAAVAIFMISADHKTMAGCSATAIAEHVLLTAEHCNVPSGVLYLNQNEEPFTNPLVITEKYFDHHDHMILVVPGVQFRHFANYDPLAYRPLEVGEHYYFWGNPGLLLDQYREGYMTGYVPNGGNGDLDVSGLFSMFASSVIPGDSGSVIYSAVDGRVVGITTYNVFGGFFGGAFALNFTPQQVAQAEGRGSFVYLPDARPVVNVVVQAPPTTQEISDRYLLILAALAVFYVFRPVFFWMFSTLGKAPGALWKTPGFLYRTTKTVCGKLVRIFRLLRSA